MSDSSYLSWPFLDEAHRELERLEAPLDRVRLGDGLDDTRLFRLVLVATADAAALTGIRSAGSGNIHCTSRRHSPRCPLNHPQLVHASRLGAGGGSAP